MAGDAFVCHVSVKSGDGLKTRMVPDHPERLKAYLSHYEGERLILTLRREKKPRSNSQNRTYWMWLSCIEDETGNDRDTLHEYLKQKFLSQWNESLKAYIARSTSDLDTGEFSSYMDKINGWAVDQGIFLPMPDDPAWESFQEKYKDWI